MAPISGAMVKMSISLVLPLRLNNQKAHAMAGFTGLHFNDGMKIPAKCIAQKYADERMIVWMAASFVNLVVVTVDDRYIKVRMNAAKISKIT